MYVVENEIFIWIMPQFPFQRGGPVFAVGATRAERRVSNVRIIVSSIMYRVNDARPESRNFYMHPVFSQHEQIPF